MMAYNLTRMIAIIGINEFKRKMEGLSAYLLAFIATPRTKFAALCRFEILNPKSLKANFAII
jgi:hypothetical protein